MIKNRPYNYSIYNLDGVTVEELLCQFADLISQCVDDVNKYTEIVENFVNWIKEEGLKQEVLEVMNDWKNDGTLASIINEEIFSDLNNKIVALEDEMTSFKSEVNTDFTNLETELNGKIDTSVSNMNTQFNTLKADIQSDFTELEGEVNNKIDSQNTEINNIKEVLDKQKFVTIYLNEYGNIAKEGTDAEDWSLAFKHVINNIAKDTCAKIIWNGRLKVKSTITLVEGVTLEGVGLPWSGLNIPLDFVGNYVIEDNNIETHNSIRNIYFDFTNNPNVKGIKILNPYDYCEYKFLVANSISNTFMDIGGSAISQTARLQDIVVYRNPEGGSNEIIKLNNCQEFHIENCKFLYKGKSSKRCVSCDGVTNTLFIHNSFLNATNSLTLEASTYPKRLTGNVIFANLFENVWDRCITIIGIESSDMRGSYNVVRDNSYFSSDNKIALQHIDNMIIEDNVYIADYGDVRRLQYKNRYDVNSKETYGSVQDSVDGNYKITKSWFKIQPTQTGTPSYFYLTAPNGTEYYLHLNDSGELQITQA